MNDVAFAERRGQNCRHIPSKEAETSYADGLIIFGITATITAMGPLLGMSV